MASASVYGYVSITGYLIKVYQYGRSYDIEG